MITTTEMWNKRIDELFSEWQETEEYKLAYGSEDCPSFYRAGFFAGMNEVKKMINLAPVKPLNRHQRRAMFGR